MTQPQAPEFTPIRPNPYIVGNPVRGRAMFFGREAEFELVRKRFQHASRGGLLVFCGERRSGKTSILFQIVDRRLGPDFIPVLIDMQSMATGSEVEFLEKISAEVLAALAAQDAATRPEGRPDGSRPEVAPPRFVPGTSHSATFQKFIRAVLDSRPGQKLILLFDEYELFENKIDGGTLDRDVLYILANLMENHPVFLIFTGSQHLEERRRDYWNILGKTTLYKTISYLEKADAVQLVVRPLEGRARYENGAVEAIYRLAAGQAFYTQAICQSLVDHMNEQRTNVATPESVAAVVASLVDNPLPQMIFLWDGLARDEKLVLALLAETLRGPDAWATAAEVTREIRRREYPLDLEIAGVSTALEKLFKSEMVLKNEASPPGYAFRMDLWRLWIRRQHSVWQVMREEGLEIRQGWLTRLRRRRIAGMPAPAAAAAGLALAAAALALAAWPRRPAEIGTVVAGPSASYTVRVVPETATIHLNGQPIGMGWMERELPAGPEHRVRLTAAGFADSEYAVRLEAGRPLEARVELRALVGDLRVETRPPGAEVSVGGRSYGPSPVVVYGLAAGRVHRVSATLPGHQPALDTASVAPGAQRVARLVLAVGRHDLLVESDPAGAEIRVDGTPRGRAPLGLSGLAPGPHTFAAQRPGYLPVETTLTVSAGLREVSLRMVPAPPGELVVQGDRMAVEIYLDDRLIVGNVQNSGVRQLPAGEHQVQVVVLSGGTGPDGRPQTQTIARTIEVRPRERVIFDFTSNTLSRRPLGGAP